MKVQYEEVEEAARKWKEGLLVNVSARGKREVVATALKALIKGAGHSRQQVSDVLQRTVWKISADTITKITSHSDSSRDYAIKDEHVQKIFYALAILSAETSNQNSSINVAAPDYLGSYRKSDFERYYSGDYLVIRPKNIEGRQGFIVYKTSMFWIDIEDESFGGFEEVSSNPRGDSRNYTGKISIYSQHPLFYLNHNNIVGPGRRLVALRYLVQHRIFVGWLMSCAELDLGYVPFVSKVAYIRGGNMEDVGFHERGTDHYSKFEAVIKLGDEIFKSSPFDF